MHRAREHLPIHSIILGLQTFKVTPQTRHSSRLRFDNSSSAPMFKRFFQIIVNRLKVQESASETSLMEILQYVTEILQTVNIVILAVSQ